MAKAKKTPAASTGAATPPAAKASGKKKAASKPAAPAAPGVPQIDTSLAAANAARMIGAKVAPPPTGETRKETSAFKQLKEHMNKPAAGGIHGVLNSTASPASKKSGMPFGDDRRQAGQPQPDLRCRRQPLQRPPPNGRLRSIGRVSRHEAGGAWIENETRGTEKKTKAVRRITGLQPVQDVEDKEPGSARPTSSLQHGLKTRDTTDRLARASRALCFFLWRTASLSAANCGRSFRFTRSGSLPPPRSSRGSKSIRCSKTPPRPSRSRAMIQPSSTIISSITRPPASVARQTAVYLRSGPLATSSCATRRAALWPVGFGAACGSGACRKSNTRVPPAVRPAGGERFTFTCHPRTPAGTLRMPTANPSTGVAADVTVDSLACPNCSCLNLATAHFCRQCGKPVGESLGYRTKMRLGDPRAGLLRHHDQLHRPPGAQPPRAAAPDAVRHRRHGVRPHRRRLQPLLRARPTRRRRVARPRRHPHRLFASPCSSGASPPSSTRSSRTAFGFGVMRTLPGRQRIPRLPRGDEDPRRVVPPPRAGAGDGLGQRRVATSAR